MFSPIWQSSAVKSLALALVLTFAFSCYIFPSRSPDLFFFFNQISDDSATEQNLFCTAIRNEAERGKVRGLFFPLSHPASPYPQLYCGNRLQATGCGMIVSLCRGAALHLEQTVVCTMQSVMAWETPSSPQPSASLDLWFSFPDVRQTKFSHVEEQLSVRQRR